MTALLTDNLPLLSGAPNGIKKLRELILELAVRGKLVPQDPSDEPASELLNLLITEAGSATGRGKGKKQALPGITESEQLFILPEGWVWGRLGDVTEVLDSLRKPVTKQDRKPGPYPYYGASGVVDYVSAYIFDEPLVLVGEDGAKWGAGERTAFSISGKTWVNNHAHVLRPKRSVILDDYLVISLVAQDLNQFITGMTVPKLNQARLTSIGISLPPLAEQHRIVAKVDELMALCDRLEARQADSESASAQLVQALLDSLTQARDAEDFTQSWRRLAEHFHTLFTTESSIDALKQTLLQLAVMGKLLPQDSRDEPASELLKRVSEEKARLVAEGKLKKQKPLGDIAISDIPFDVPDNWAWSRIGEISLNTEYGLSEKTFDLQDGVPVLKMGDIQEGRVLLGGQMAVSKNTEGLPGLFLETEDLLYNRTNSAELVGKTGVFLGRAGEYSFASYLIRIRCLKELFSPLYLNISMNAPGFRETQINPHLKQQCGQANVNGTIMKNMLVSVPPLPEQHRIVAKVDQLMALCEQLKTRLNQALQVHEHLANALVEQAVA